MSRLEINLTTGEQTVVPLTQEEQVEIASRPKPPNPRIAQIEVELAALDLKLIRPLSEGESARVAALVAQKATLRAELAAL